jgi:hypothetical protein
MEKAMALVKKVLNKLLEAQGDLYEAKTWEDAFPGKGQEYAKEYEEYVGDPATAATYYPTFGDEGTRKGEFVADFLMNGIRQAFPFVMRPEDLVKNDSYTVFTWKKLGASQNSSDVRDGARFVNHSDTDFSGRPLAVARFVARHGGYFEIPHAWFTAEAVYCFPDDWKSW